MTGRPTPWLVAIAIALFVGPAAGTVPDPPVSAIRETAGGVFNRPEFRPERSEPSWLVRQFLAFFTWLGGLYETSPLLFWLVLVACLVALAAMIGLIVVQIRFVFARGGWGRTASDNRAVERARLSDSYREEAARKAAAGDYTEAVRFLFLSLVYRFDERGKVNFQTAYTNREYLDLLDDRVKVHDALAVIVDALDEHWYGQRPCGRAQYEACLTAYERLAATA
ncbi:DUF4129 domain-containing protein [Fimbriiglobus ruber]|uniref:Protein-glutamine gamma-glutamyltransferase-like C-terminal domain-containing protein n=1 Tax=Fimbriiglobus ruber TaxID=1908690 RepID=A0A225DRI1_9BACT|nr:DUF4129 domain-containing protein [Fimbriiglobus ruber]OWK42244.1 hypothetical protein FRUB_04322 [Fimbriiglobus ruber]